MEGIAAYGDDDASNPSMTEEGVSEHEGAGEEGSPRRTMDHKPQDMGDDEDSGLQAEAEDREDNEDSNQKEKHPFSAYEDVEDMQEEEGELPGEEKRDEDMDQSSNRNGTEEEEEEEVTGPRVLPQEVTTPFSLASFLSNNAPKISDDDPPQEKERDVEFAYVNGAYSRVAKNKVDIEDLDRRLDHMRQNRREEIGLLKMYGLDDREDRQGGGGRGDRNADGKDRNRDDAQQRSRSRSKDRDREKRRSRSRERRRSRSKERRRSRSRDRSSRRDKESPERGRGRDDRDRAGRDKYGRDRDDKYGRDREDKYGRDKDRSGRGEKDRFGRDRDRGDREDRKEDHGRSRSPRNDRRDSYRDRPSGGRDYNQDTEKPRQDQSLYGGEQRRGGGYPGDQDLYPSQPPPQEPYQQTHFQGAPPGGFNVPPPSMDPYSAPPPQPWMGGPPPPTSQFPDFGQPPPSMNNGAPYGMDSSYQDAEDQEPMDLELPGGGNMDEFQSRVVEEVKTAIRPYFSSKKITKDHYREIFKKCVPKVSSSGEINPKKINNLVGAYVKKMAGKAK